MVRRWLTASLLVLVGCTSAPAVDGSETTDDSDTAPPLEDDGGTEPSPGSTGDEGSLDSAGELGDGIEWLCPEPGVAPRFELGWDYKDGWIDLEEGGPVTITIGGQGAWMIPVGVRGEGFCVPADPFEYDHVPTLDVTINAEGHTEPVTAVVDFPVSFEPIEEGGLGYTFIPMMFADAVDIDALEGLATTIRAELYTRDLEPLSFVLDGQLTISD